MRGSCDAGFDAESVCRRELGVAGAQGRWKGGRIEGRVNIRFINGSRHSVSFNQGKDAAGLKFILKV